MVAHDREVRGRVRIFCVCVFVGGGQTESRSVPLSKPRGVHTHVHQHDAGFCRMTCIQAGWGSVAHGRVRMDEARPCVSLEEKRCHSRAQSLCLRTTGAAVIYGTPTETRAERSWALWIFCLSAQGASLHLC